MYAAPLVSSTGTRSRKGAVGCLSTRAPVFFIFSVAIWESRGDRHVLRVPHHRGGPAPPRPRPSVQLYECQEDGCIRKRVACLDSSIKT
jgi:hypothetical protein